MNTQRNDDIFALSPEEFRQQEEAERREAQEKREAIERKKREEVLLAAQKKALAEQALRTRWTRWLTAIGRATTLPFEVRQTPSIFRPCDLVVDGVSVPVGEAPTRWFSLEISMPYYTARYDHYHRRNARVEEVRARQKSDGSFDYEKLGRFAFRYVQVVKKHEREEAAKKSGAALVKRLTEELGYSSMEPSTDPQKPVQFKFSMNRDMTEAEVRATYAALKLAGLIK